MRIRCIVPVPVLIVCFGLSHAADTPKVAALKTLVSSTGAGNTVREYQTLEIDLGKNTTDQDLKKLADLAVPSITKMNLATTDSKITAAGIKHVAKLADLEWLRVDYDFNDDGLKSLQGMKKLQSLILFQSKITDGGLAGLTKLPKLQELDFQRADVTDAAFEPLSKITTLTKLNLSETQITGKGIERLGALKKLQVLKLDYCKKLTEDSLAGVGKLTTLTELDISSNAISDASLKSLHGLVSLRKLNLSTTKVTSGGIAELKKALPKCTVTE